LVQLFFVIERRLTRRIGCHTQCENISVGDSNPTTNIQKLPGMDFAR